MERRRFIRTLGVGTAGAAVAACSGERADCPEATATTEKQQTFKWKLVTSWPKNFPGLGTAPERLAVLVKKMSAGRLDIRVYGANELVPALEVFDSVSQGTVEMGHCAAYYWKGKAPEAQFFTAVPFGLTAQEINGWLHYGGGLELWQEVYARYNLIPAAGGNTGVQMAGWFNREINSLDDLKGLKMRIPGLGGEVLKRAGGVPVTLPGGELFTSLQTGAIDATEWVGPYNDLTFGLHKAARYYYYPGWHEPGAMLEFMINKNQYAKLPADLQEILMTACRAVNQDMLDEYTARNNAALRELVEVHDVQLRKLPDEVLMRLRELSEDVVAETVAGNPLAEKIYASFLEFRRNVASYHAISEQAYINARTLTESVLTSE